MTEKEMKKLSRVDLLEMLVDQSTELQSLRQKLKETEEALEKKETSAPPSVILNVTEPAPELNGFIDLAKAAYDQYINQLNSIFEKQVELCAQMEDESIERIEERWRKTVNSCNDLENETKIKCAEMVSKAKAEAEAQTTTYWNEVSTKLEAFYDAHKGLRELMAISMPKMTQDDDV